MSKLRVLFVPLLTLLPIVTGCGGYDCNDLCNDSKKCENSTTTNLDCGSACDGVKKLNDETDCSSKWDDLMKCVGDQKDKCSNNSTACDSQGTAWAQCITPYCTDTAHTQECSTTLSAFGGA